MIRIDHYADDETSTFYTRYHGYQIDADGVSSEDSFNLDRKATNCAIERYLAHRERLYADPPRVLAGSTAWLVHGLARLPSNIIWEDFHVYFLLAKLRILFSDAPQPVEYPDTFDPSVSEAVEKLCTEFEVECVKITQQGGKNDMLHEKTSPVSDVKARIFPWFTERLDYYRRWVILFAFIFLRPIILKLYGTARSPVDVRFWLHPVEDHTNRLYDVPAELESRGFRVGYAVYDFVAINAIKALLKTGVKKIPRALDSDHPISVEWYIDPADFHRTLVEAPDIREAIQTVGTRARNHADSPEYAYLGRQLESISTRLIIQTLLLEHAIQGFSANVTDDRWCHARGLPKLTSRLLALVGEREDIATVGVSPHYHSETRVAYRFTDTEVHGPEANSHPDVFAVFEPSSAETLRGQGLPTRISVARDKIETETFGGEEGNVIRTHLQSSPSASVSPPDDRQARVLVILTLPRDNREILDAIEDVSNEIPAVKFVFKPHPLVPKGDGLFDGIRGRNVDFEVAAPDASLADLVEECDVCIAMYSTAAIPALARATPIVWVPLESPNHVRMDLIDRVGIRVDNSVNLAEALERLVRDDSFYVEQARECAAFAANHLIPGAEAPSLADLIQSTHTDGDSC